MTDCQQLIPVERTLAAALEQTRDGVGGVELEVNLRVLAMQLGVHQTKRSTRDAIHAVLAMSVWSHKFNRDQDVWTAYNCSKSNFCKWKQLIYSTPCWQAMLALYGLSRGCSGC